MTKTLSTTAAVVPTPHMAEIRGGFINAERWSELPPEAFVERELPLARKAGVPLIVSLGYTASDIAALAPRVQPFADALELSTHYVGDDPAPMVDAIRAAKNAVAIPVWVKLSPFRDVQRAAEAAARAGADALVAVNSYGPVLAIDPDTGRPLLGSDHGYGWLSGAALKPLALRCVYDICRTVDLPVIGVGGVARGQDAAEMLMAGASAVQVCTAAIVRGPDVFGRIAEELGRWLDAHGYPSPQAVRGLTLRLHEAGGPPRVDTPPVVNQALCTACGACETSCVYGAIRVDGGVARVDSSRCAACGLCVTRCPPGALSWPCRDERS